MAARETIRVVVCPLCGGGADMRLSGNGLAYLAMDCCKAQLFTRGPESDELCRDLPDVPAQPLPAPPPQIAPVAALQLPPAPATTPPIPKAPAPAPAPAKPRMGWGAFPNA
ncbi:hypothetical protein CDN99_25555 [Roseateles aquatilis]|uniref:Uncharacterized protein n=1 Tax=Roseateles aquatilis TaxID=431061 RepID=A0A246IUD9_9BURK|nr:hypothetical protein [Roseateles aquatilis]OWQ83835.1 hypothetical protein CDN99_25555 [Roseateles aquatilis]